MMIVCILLFFSIVINVFFLINLSYKNHCIDDLETRLSKGYDKNVEDVLTILYDIKEYLNYEQAWRDTCIRNRVNEEIQKYSAKKRTTHPDKD